MNKKRGMIIALVLVAVIVVAGGFMLHNIQGASVQVNAAGESELLEMYNNNQSIMIEVAEPISVEEGEEVHTEWTELAFLDTYRDMRTDVDDILDITRHGQGGKNGVIYTDLEGNQTNNSTLYNAFQNRQFVENYYKNPDKTRAIAESGKSVYVDVESDKEAFLAAINGYYNLLNDSTPGYANLNSTLSRGEFLSMLVKADTPVHEIQPDAAFMELVGENEFTLLAQEAESESYLQTSDKSLDQSTFTGTITRAEAIYTLVQRYYGDEYAALTGEESAVFKDTKNGGDLALKGGFAEETKDKETKEVVRTEKDRITAYELAYALENPDNGLPTDLYKALVIAHQKMWITAMESRWDEALTKGEAINFLIKVYESISRERGYAVDVARGASEAAPIIDQLEQSPTPEIQEQAPDVEEEAYVLTREDLDPDLHTTRDESGTIVMDEVMTKAYHSLLGNKILYNLMGNYDACDADIQEALNFYYDSQCTKDEFIDAVINEGIDGLLARIALGETEAQKQRQQSAQGTQGGQTQQQPTQQQPTQPQPDPIPQPQPDPIPQPDPQPDTGGIGVVDPSLDPGIYDWGSMGDQEYLDMIEDSIREDAPRSEPSGGGIH